MLLFRVKRGWAGVGPADPMGECGSLPVASRALRDGCAMADATLDPAVRSLGWLSYRVGWTRWS